MKEPEFETDRQGNQNAVPSGGALTDGQPGSSSPIDEALPVKTPKSPWRPTGLLRSAAHPEA